MKRSKKKTARKNKKYPALDPKYTTKVRREYLDMDYLDKLSEKEKEWLNKFTEEHLNASFQNSSKDLNRSKTSKKKVYNENNARNRCLYGIAKASNRLDEVTYWDHEDKVESTNPEDAIIDYIDSQKDTDED